MIPQTIVLVTFLRYRYNLQTVLLNLFQYNCYLVGDYFLTSMLQRFYTFWSFFFFLHPKMRSMYINILHILKKLVYYLQGLKVCFQNRNRLTDLRVRTYGYGGGWEG